MIMSALFLDARIARPESDANWMGESEDIALYLGHMQGGKSSLPLVWHVYEAIGAASKI